MINSIENIQLVKRGSLSIEAGEGYDTLLYDFTYRFRKFGDSSVVYIRHKEKNYLIDTGFANRGDLSPDNLALNKKMLEHDLCLVRLTPADIHGIFITHWHLDHFGNLPIFPRARLFMYDPDKELDMEVLADRFGFSHLLPPEYLSAGDPPFIIDTGQMGDSFAGCSLFPTPGHTQNHCSVFATFKGMKICIAGDAIVSQSYYDKGVVWPFNAGNLGLEQCIRAMNTIIEKADYIVPGHGHMFQNYRRKKT